MYHRTSNLKIRYVEDRLEITYRKLYGVGTCASRDLTIALRQRFSSQRLCCISTEIDILLYRDVKCGFFINSERSRVLTAMLGAVDATPEAEDISLGNSSLLPKLNIFNVKGKDLVGFIQ